jgi:transcriptional regulator with XRE-family HTH domain
MANTSQVRDTGVMPRQTPRLPGPDTWAAQRVRKEREARGWSTAELARRVTAAGAPMRQQAIWQIENSNPPRKISYGEAIVFCQVFGIENVADLGRPPDAIFAVELAQLGDALTRSHVMAEQLFDDVKLILRTWDLLRKAEAADDQPTRRAMTAAQTGDVIRSTLGTIEQILTAIRSVAESTSLDEPQTRKQGSRP